MQVKFKRSKSEKGMIGKRTVFQLDAMLHLSAEERALFEKYKQWDVSLWLMATQGKIGPNGETEYGDLTNSIFSALARGLSFEKENLHDILYLEEGILKGCQAAMRYCKRAETFDGTDRVFEIVNGQEELVAKG